MSDRSIRNILVVEDEPLLAMDVEMTLTAAGYRVIGPALTTRDALHLVQDEALDLAVLDLNIGDDTVAPVADRLADDGTPFMILSGHSHEVVPARHKARPFMQKPYKTSELLQALNRLLERRSNGHGRKSA
ncbi:MAG TPA: response regulator [Pseudolabrys sp.]|nr:response regulator [Pseudolabrys sp.]